MNDYQYIQNLLSSDNSVPALVVENYENWTEEDALDLARQICVEVNLFPEELEKDTAPKREYGSCFVTRHYRNCALPSVRLLATGNDLSAYVPNEYKLLVPDFKAVLTKLVEKDSLGEAEVQGLVGELLFKVAGFLSEEINKYRSKMANLPLALQPSLPAFDESAVEKWFENAKKVYTKYGIKEADLTMHLRNFLPTYARGQHDELEGRPWAEYVEGMTAAFQTDNSLSAVLGNLMSMRPKEGESYRAFAHRLYGASRRANPPLPEKEICRIMLKILPHQISSLLIGRSCDKISGFIKILEEAITDKNMIDGGSVQNSFEKPKEEKILATVSSKTEEKLDKILEGLKEITVENNAMFVGKNKNTGRGGYYGRGNYRGRGYGSRSYGRGRENFGGFYQNNGYGEHFQGENIGYQPRGAPYNNGGQMPNFQNGNQQGSYQGQRGSYLGAQVDYQIGNAQWGNGRGRAAGNCFACNSPTHRVAFCPELQNFRQEVSL